MIWEIELIDDEEEKQLLKFLKPSKDKVPIKFPGKNQETRPPSLNAEFDF